MTMLLESRVTLQLQVGETAKERCSPPAVPTDITKWKTEFIHFMHEARIKRSIPALSNIIAWVLFCNSPCPCLIFLMYLWKYISISVNAWKSMEQNTKHNQCWSWCNIITHVQPPTCTRRRDVDKNGSSVRNPDTIKQSANDNSCCCKLSQAVTSCDKLSQGVTSLRGRVKSEAKPHVETLWSHTVVRMITLLKRG